MSGCWNRSLATWPATLAKGYRLLLFTPESTSVRPRSRISVHPTDVDELVSLALSEKERRRDRAQILKVDETLSALIVVHAHLESIRGNNAHLGPPQWGYIAPLRTAEDAMAALRILNIYATGKWKPEWDEEGLAVFLAKRRFQISRAKPSLHQHLANRILESVGKVPFALLIFALVLLTVRFAGGYRRWQRAVEAQHKIDLEDRESFRGFSFRSKRAQLAFLSKLEARRVRKEREAAEDRSEERRKDRLRRRSDLSSPGLEATSPPSESPPPTEEALDALVDMIEREAGRADVSNTLRTKVKGEVVKAREQSNPRRAARILQHARGLLEETEQRSS